MPEFADRTPGSDAEPTHHQYIVIGAGPAGIQLSYFLQQAGADYLTFEREAAPGLFFQTFPRHRKLISLNKVHVHSDEPEIRLRWDWNSLLNGTPARLSFPEYSDDYFPAADDLVRYLADFQRVHELAVQYNTGVQRVERSGEGFLVHTEDAVYSCRCLISATGWGAPHVPPIRGIDHAVGYEEMKTDPQSYADQRVLIIGKGNSAFETASSMLGQASMIHLASRQPLRLAWNTKHPGDVRGQFGAILDSYQFKTLHSVLDCSIDEIRPVGDHFEVDITYTHADGETATLEYESVIRCTGFRMNTDMFDSDCKPEMVRDARMPRLRPDWQASNVDNLYFAGTIAQDRDSKHASSPFVDGFRYNLRTFSALLRERYDGVPLAYDEVSADPEVLTSLVLDRVNWSSALWTQFEYLCDVLVPDEETGKLRHYIDMPEDYAVTRFQDAPYFYTYGLRWGRTDYTDVFAIERHPNPVRAEESAFIHPVIRQYRGAEIAVERHLLEDLLAEWRRPDRHVAPLRAFFSHGPVEADAEVEPGQ
jgi:thioredoxin reductase